MTEHRQHRVSNSVHALAISIALVAVLASAQVAAAADSRRKKPEAAVWGYLDIQFEKASMDPTYWKKRWNLETNPRRNELHLGRPFSDYCLGAEDLEFFVRSGDLLGSAFLVYVSYPVFCRNQLIGTIQVAENDGQWAFVSRHLVGSPVDSLVVALVAHGDSVATLGGQGIGAFVLITRLGASEMRVRSLTRNALLVPHADEQGTVSYRLACEVLRPAAEEWLSQQRQREKERH